MSDHDQDPILTDQELGILLDHARSFHSRIVKPFLTLPRVIEGTMMARQAQHAAETELERLRAETVGAQADHQAALDRLADTQRQADAETDRIKAALADQWAHLRDARLRTQAELAQVKEQGAADIALAEAETTARKETLAAEIAALELRVAALVTTRDGLTAEMERLRARLTV